MEKIKLSITTIQYTDEETSGPIEFLCDGVKYESDGKVVIEYDEAEAIGFEDVKTLIEVENEKVTMSRRGKIKTDMVFEKGHTFEGNYITPLGTMSMTMFATTVETDVAGKKGHVELEYEMNLEDLHTFNTLYLKYEHANGGEKVIC